MATRANGEPISRGGSIGALRMFIAAFFGGVVLTEGILPILTPTGGAGGTRGAIGTLRSRAAKL